MKNENEISEPPRPQVQEPPPVIIGENYSLNIYPNAEVHTPSPPPVQVHPDETLI